MGHLLTLKEVSLFLFGEHTETTKKRIYKLIGKNELKTVRTGRLYLFPKNQSLLQGIENEL